MFDIRTYGAAPEKSAGENGLAIQSAIDAAYSAGGGTVIVPVGRFVSSNLQLRSNVQLYLDAGAELCASMDWRDYRYTNRKNTTAPDMAGINAGAHNWVAFIWAENEENVSVVGPGTINGQGEEHKAFPAKDDPNHRRPHLLLFLFCRHVHVTDVRLVDPAVYTVFGVCSQRIWVRGVSVDSRRTENGDGLDFDGCEEVMISDCTVNAGDDAIGLKSTYTGHPCREIAVTNCRISTIWAGLRVGPEGTCDYRDIVLNNCVFKDCGDAIKIQNTANGVIENVRISNCVMRDVRRPIFLTRNSFRLSNQDPSLRPASGGVRNIVIDGITAEQSTEGEGYMRCCCVLSGTMEDRVEDITLRNIKFRFCGGGTEESAARTDVPEYIDYSFLYPDIFSINGHFPAAGLYLRHIRGLRMENCDFSLQAPDERPMLYAYDGEGETEKLRGTESITAVESSITGIPMKALPEALLRKHEAAVRDSVLTDGLFAKWAKEVDRADEYDILKLFPEEEWTKTDKGMKLRFDIPGAKMVRLDIFGNMECFLNGVSLGACRIPKLYENRVKWAADLTGLLREGENELEIVWDDPAQTGGVDSLLPFGVFEKLHVGLTAPARIVG